MFTYKLVLDNNSDFPAELNKFSARLQSAEINAEDSKFLMEQIEAATLQYQKHLSLNNAKSFSMNRLFEGNGYKVSLNLGNSSKGFFAKLVDAFRG